MKDGAAGRTSEPRSAEEQRRLICKRSDTVWEGKQKAWVFIEKDLLPPPPKIEYM